MSRWIFHLTGLLVVVLVSLLFLDRFLNPEMPDYIDRGVDVRTQGEGGKPAHVDGADAAEVPPLRLTSLEGEGNIQQDGTVLQAGAQANNVGTTQLENDQAAISLTALEEQESVPVLSNPDSPRTNVWLQAGSFGERANAEKRSAVLKAHGWSIEIEPAVVEGRTFYRVYVGPLTKDQVNGYMDKLNTMGINAREINR